MKTFRAVILITFLFLGCATTPCPPSDRWIWKPDCIMIVPEGFFDGDTYQDKFPFFEEQPSGQEDDVVETNDQEI